MTRTYLRILYMQGASYTTEGVRDTKQAMTCNLPQQILRQQSRSVNFDAIRPADSNFSKLSPGGTVQMYAVSVSNNGRVFGSSQTFSLLFNITCMSCDDTGPVQRVSKLTICLTRHLLTPVFTCFTTFTFSPAARYLSFHVLHLFVHTKM